MSQLFRHSGLVILLLLSSFFATAGWLEEYANYISKDAKTHNIPGFAWTFVERDSAPKVVAQGHTRKGGSLIAKDTVFRLASVSKTFTGALIAKLHAQKQLNYHASIDQIAPTFGFKQHGRDNITLLHVLNQSSGYMPNAYDNLIEANYPLSRVLGMLAELDPLCQPGKCYTYQNALFGVIEDYFHQRNSSYQSQVSKQLLAPLGMKNTSVGLNALKSAKHWAKPHIAIARDKYRQGQANSAYYKYAPAAGINASIADMQIWLEAMLGQYPNVLSSSIIKEITTPMTKTKRELGRRNWKQYLDDAHYGLGWRIYQFEGHKLVYHGGWVKGYRADIAFAPEFGVGFAMLMNAESNRINQYSAEFWASYFAQIEAPQDTLLAD